MKYKVSDVKRILNISEDTIRYFDNQKIIRTNRDKKNNYRYFDSKDINKIFAYKMYRSFHFTMNESIMLVSGKSVDTLESMLTNQIDVIEKEQEYLERAKEHIIMLNEKLAKWKSFKGGFEVTKSPNCFYHFNQTDTSFLRTEDVYENNHHCLSYLPDIWPCYYFDSDEKKETSSAFSYGYGLYTTKNIPIQGLLHIPSRDCLYTMFLIEESTSSYLPLLLSQAEEYARIHGLKLKGTVFGNILHELKKEGCITRLFDAYIPIF